MTTHLSVVQNSPETRSTAVARRLRGQMAELKIQSGDMAKALGVSRTWVTRRTTGETSLSVEELAQIENATGISADYLFTGTGTPKAPHPDDPDGGLAVRHQGLEPRTRWFGVEADQGCVVPFPSADEHAERRSAA